MTVEKLVKMTVAHLVAMWDYEMALQKAVQLVVLMVGWMVALMALQ